MDASANSVYQPLAGAKVLLGVCGGIAAYKSVLLLRMLQQAGAEVQVITTPSAQTFVGAATFAALTGKPVYSTFTEADTGSWHNHVAFGLWADALVIAPATAATLAKAATAQADNLLLATYLSARCPVLWCPAMDVDMYAHPAVQANLEKLRGFGNTVLDADTGPLASGLSGQGRLPEPEVILEQVRKLLHTQPWWQSKKVLITAGPTYERIDPVRFIGNFSSGKMGYALAHEAAARGAEVVLVTGPCAERVFARGLQVIEVESADEMLEACHKHSQAGVVIHCAAVADFKAKAVSAIKIKKTDHELTITLTENVDIATHLSLNAPSKQIRVGFALESGDGSDAARAKLAKKNLHLICLNSLDAEHGSPLGAVYNSYRLLQPTGPEILLPFAPKQALAGQILDVIKNL